MATGFRPKSEQIIELRGYSTDDLMLLAVEAARYLGWQIGTVRCDKLNFIHLQVSGLGRKRLLFQGLKGKTDSFLPPVCVH